MDIFKVGPDIWFDLDTESFRYRVQITPREAVASAFVYYKNYEEEDARPWYRPITWAASYTIQESPFELKLGKQRFAPGEMYRTKPITATLYDKLISELNKELPEETVNKTV